ncbi:MAG: c-type cytochrome [Anaerolineales bacterium]|nr:c-type cytochrome [Anaerolineales bacterium]
MSRVSDWLNRNSMLIALAAAWIATLGSLYFSEVRGYIPCTLCWYQRILMYPLAGFIFIGLVRRDWNLPYYVLPFSVLGIFVSTYHYLLEKTSLFDANTVCKQGALCTTQWINWFGFVTIPFLALMGFLIITIMSIIALVQQQPSLEDAEGEPVRMPWLKVSGTVVAILAVFAVLFITGTTDASAEQGSAATTSAFPMASVTPGPLQAVSSDATVARGKDLYYQVACAACHGMNAEGVPTLGNALAKSEFITGKSDADLLAFLRAGRDASSPDNTTGVTMPPSGGRPDLSDDDMLAVIAYLRTMQ